MNATNQNDDVSKSQKFRSKCMSFDWFMDQIAYNNSLYFPPKEISRLADGKLKNIGNGFCVGLGRSRRFLKFYECHKVGEKASFEWWEAISFRNGLIGTFLYVKVTEGFGGTA